MTENVEYKQKYEELIQHILSLRNITRTNIQVYFKEPAWPDKIEDRKLVIQFRNEVFDSAFEKGALSAFSRILEHIDVMVGEEEG